MYLSVALLNGLILYTNVSPYVSYVPLAKIHWHMLYTQSTSPLEGIVHVMWLKDVCGLSVLYDSTHCKKYILFTIKIFINGH